MAKFISNDLSVYIENDTTTPYEFSVANTNAITTIVEAVPGAITVADATLATTGVAAGDIIEITGSTMDKVDGELFALGTVPDSTPGDIPLIGVDFIAGDKAIYDQALVDGAVVVGSVLKAIDMTKICLSEFEIAEATTNDIDTSTFCETSSLPGPVTLGSVTFTGYVDTSDVAYTALKEMFDDGDERTIKIVGPDNQYWVGRVKLGSISWSFARGDVVTFTFSATQVKAIKHIF